MSKRSFRCQRCKVPTRKYQTHAGDWLELDAHPHPEGGYALLKDLLGGMVASPARGIDAVRYHAHYQTCTMVPKRVRR